MGGSTGRSNGQASWLNPVSLDEAIEPAAPVVAREPPSIPEAVGLAPAAHRTGQQAADAVPAGPQVQRHSERPAQLARPIEDALFSSISTAWRADHEAAIDSQDATIERLDTQRGKVRIVSRGGTLSDDRGLLPVTIRNQLDQPVAYGLVWSRPTRCAYVPMHLLTIRIDAQAVNSSASNSTRWPAGDLLLNAQILTPDGNAYSEPVSLNVDVRGYGRVALLVFGVAAVLMVIAAGVRIARRTGAAHRARR